MVSTSILTMKQYSHVHFTNIYESKPALADWLTLAQPRHTLPSLGGIREVGTYECMFPQSRCPQLTFHVADNLVFSPFTRNMLKSQTHAK